MQAEFEITKQIEKDLKQDTDMDLSQKDSSNTAKFELLPNELIGKILKIAELNPLQFRLINKHVNVLLSPMLSGIYGKNIKQSFFNGVKKYDFKMNCAESCLNFYLKNSKNAEEFNIFVEEHFKSLLQMFSTKNEKTSLAGYKSQFTQPELKDITLGITYLAHHSSMTASNLKLAREFLLEFLKKCADIEVIDTKIMGTFLIEDKDKNLCIEACIERLNKIFPIRIESRTSQEQKFKVYLNFAIRNNFGIYMDDEQRSIVVKLISKFHCTLPTDFVFLFNPESENDKKYFNKIFENNLHRDSSLNCWFEKVCQLHLQTVNNLLNETNSKILFDLLSNKESTMKFSAF